jgi:uncharacterized membrane protein
MSNLRATAYLCFILSFFFLVAPLIVALDEDVLLSAVFLGAGIVLGVMGLALYRRNRHRRKKGKALF